MTGQLTTNPLSQQDAHRVTRRHAKGATQGKLRQDLTELDSDRKNAFIAAARSTEMPPHSLLVLVSSCLSNFLKWAEPEVCGWAVNFIRTLPTANTKNGNCPADGGRRSRLIGSYRSLPCVAPLTPAANGGFRVRELD